MKEILKKNRGVLLYALVVLAVTLASMLTDDPSYLLIGAGFVVWTWFWYHYFKWLILDDDKVILPVLKEPTVLIFVLGDLLLFCLSAPVNGPLYGTIWNLVAWLFCPPLIVSTVIFVAIILSFIKMILGFIKDIL